MSRTGLPLLILGASALALSACVTPRLHSDAQLNAIGQRCGLALGELIQDEEQKKLLLMIRQSPTRGQRVCVIRWARDNHLKPVFIQMDFPQS